ncbi:hypothetical protein ABZP36_013553 [Zizania latifolia]
MIHTAIDTFYLTAEQLWSSPSLRDGIDQLTEPSLRLRLPQAVMCTRQILLRFYCKQSFARFSVKEELVKDVEG